ncbi:MAG: hypothetical protein AB1492_07280 [Bacillota bacterium]
MDYVWTLLFVAAIVAAMVNGRPEALTKAATEGAAATVQLGMTLAGALALWNGLLRVAAKGGVLDGAGRLLRPILRPLFPSLPAGHAAFTHIVANTSANLLGLGSAATPAGLKAMAELETLNPKRGTATDAMCTLLVLNTVGVGLFPATVLSLRAAMGSNDPAATVVPAVLASLCALAAGLILDRTLRRRWR